MSSFDNEVCREDNIYTSLFTVNGSKSKKKMKKYTKKKLFTTYQFSITHSGDY